MCLYFFFFKQKTAYEMRISDWSSDVCSSDLAYGLRHRQRFAADHRLVDIARPFLDNPIHRHLVAGADAQPVAFAQLIERHFAFLAGSDDFHSSRRGKFEQGAKRARCRTACLQLQQLAKQDTRSDDPRQNGRETWRARMCKDV